MIDDASAARTARPSPMAPARSPFLYMPSPRLRSDEPLTLRQMKEIALSGRQHTLVLVSHAAEIPDELRPLSAKFSLSLPDNAALEAMMHEESAEWGRKHNRSVKAHKEAVQALLNNLSGLTWSDARQLIRNAIYDDGMLTEDDIGELLKTKYRLLDARGVISVTERQSYIGRVRALAKMCADAFVRTEAGGYAG